MQTKRLIFFAIAICFTQFIFASNAVAGPADDTLGWAINNFVESTSSFTRILVIMSYMAGTYLAVNGTLKFKDHVDNPQQIHLNVPVRKLLAGGAFLSLPFMMSAVYESLFGSGTAGLSITDRTTGSLDPDSMEGMIVGFMTNISGPVNFMLTAFCYIAGIAILMVGISRLTRRVEDGPRGPGGAGTITCFIVAGALMAFGDSATIFSSSIFGDSELKTNAQISDTVISSDADRERIEMVIEALMAFVMMVGYIAFIRGWFVLKSFADGNQSATIAQGLTFLIGGTLAINLGDLINMLQKTLGITGGALAFG